MRFMLNWLFTSIAIAIATFLVPGIQPFGFAETWVCFAFVGLFLNIAIRSSNRSSRSSRCRSRSLRWAFSSLSSTALCLSSRVTCRSTCWASASPSPALDRPLWAASWCPSRAASSTASPRTKMAIPAVSVSTAQNEGRPSQKWAAFLFAKSQRARKSTISTPSPNAGVG